MNQYALEPATIAEYSPNIEWGRQTVSITVMQWGYSAVLETKIGGNCTGFGILEAAVGSVFESLVPVAGGPARIDLVNPTGETLLCIDEEDRDEDWLKDMVVSAKVIAYDPPTLNEVRAMNGAKPLPDGDRPWSPL